MTRAAVVTVLSLALLPALVAVAGAQEEPPRPALPGAMRAAPEGGVPTVPTPAAMQPRPAPGAPEVVAGGPTARPARTGKGTAVAFWIFALTAVAGAIATITRKNAVAAVMCLVGTFLALAALFVMLFAHFLAVIQVLVYAGAIMVLFIFVVMILNKEEEEPWALRGWVGKVIAGGALIYLMVRLVDVLWQVKGRVAEVAWKPGEFQAYGSTKAVGRELFTSYLFPFEAVSLVLLIAVVGALVLGRRELPAEEQTQAEEQR